jgi:hypothetical protein
VSPLSGPVLGGAAIVSAPALWGAVVDGTTTPQSAVLRYLVCVVLCWAALAVVGMLVGPAPRPPATAAGESPEVAAAPEGEPTG